MNRYAGIALLVLALIPGLALAADNKFFDCQVYDTTINGGQGSAARQGDVPVSAASLVAAEQQVRKEYPAWQDGSRFAVQCRENEEV